MMMSLVQNIGHDSSSLAQNIEWQAADFSLGQLVFKATTARAVDSGRDPELGSDVGETGSQSLG